MKLNHGQHSLWLADPRLAHTALSTFPVRDGLETRFDDLALIENQPRDHFSKARL